LLEPKNYLYFCLQTGLGLRSIRNLKLPTEPIESAKEAGLRYVTDTRPGIARKKRGKNFIYLQPDEKLLRDRDELIRIKCLAIPPAWTEVWICPSANGHLQATGRDARARKQYRYHSRWREVRDSTKYDRMMAFAKALPKIRRRVQRDIKLKGLPRDKVIAAVVRLLETTLIRIGNDEYARENQSYGLTTMRNRHAKVSGERATFEFYGKSHRRHVISVDDPILAKIVKHCRDLPGYELFQYVEPDGERQKLHSDDVNQYLREITGEDFSAKDFRTWSGTVMAFLALKQFPKFASSTRATRNVAQAVEAVARVLGNTPAVCKKCYIHPAIIDSYVNGSWFRNGQRKSKPKQTPSKFKAEEIAVMELLQRVS
jgi:DNA topoisomerase-1